ncbi:Hsp70 family protein [Kitasatospora purpeofusca]|uniref:Hsp70 family protein n=1 Tax=Kitasatospora purpeofusca TaxID=67352 RepID=UPI0012FF3872|nr:Hsp70 family protein [Kitasatospora purpeofusca]
MSDWSLAIDFGTCFTTAAVRAERPGTESGARSGVASDGAGSAATAVEIENSRYLPSLVCLGDDGRLLTGRAAVQLAAQRPERAEQHPKRALLRQPAVLLDDREVDTVDLVAAVLARVAGEARAVCGGTDPARTVLTHPADWSPADLDRLVEAAGRAGLDAPELLPEPVAAARFHAANARAGDGAPIAVYDLGGGTVDTAVLRREGDGFRAVAVAGDPDFGGRDLDQALFELLRDRALDLDPAPWQRLQADRTPVGSHQRSQLSRELTLAKESLSSTGTVYLAVPGYPEPFVVQGGEYRAAVTPALTASVGLLERTVARAGLTPAELGAVVLCGAASRTPPVADLVAARLGRIPELAADPKAAVALGALTDPPAPPPPDGAAAGGTGSEAAGPGRWAVAHYPAEVDPWFDYD